MLVYDGRLHKAAWMMPSEANIQKQINPCAEEIDEFHPHYSVYAKLAGPKPEIWESYE